MSNVSREKLWTKEIWEEIDRLVTAQVGPLRVAQQVFPSVKMPDAPYVSGGALAQGLRIQEGANPFMDISVEFVLTYGQLINEATLHTAQTLAQIAARSIALAEDALFFQGAAAPLPPGVIVQNQNAAGQGLLNLPPQGNQVPAIPRQLGGGFGEGTFTAVGDGIRRLTAGGQPGPYALILDPAVFVDTYATNPNMLTTPGDRIRALFNGRMYSGALPADTGLLASLGGSPTTIYIAQDAVTTYVLEDAQGDHRFRVFERVQIVPREPQAFVRLMFAAQGAQGRPQGGQQPA